MIYLKTLSFIMMVLFLSCSVASAQIIKEGGDYVQEIAEAFEVSGEGTLSVEAIFGTMKANLSEDRNVRVSIKEIADVSTEKKAKELFEKLDVIIKQSGNDVFINVKKKKRFSGIKKLRLSFELSVPRNYNVGLNTGGGSIDVVELVGDADLNSGGGNITMRHIEGNGEAKTGGGSIKIEGVSKNVSAKTGGGKIKMSNISGNAKASTGGGSIKIEGVLKNVSAKTGGGSIEIMGSEGQVRANTGGGSIRVGGSHGPVSVNTGGGGIDIEEAKGSISANTGGGSISAEVLGLQEKSDEIKLSSGGGSLTLHIPEDLLGSFDVELNLRKPKKDYRIISDFPLEIHEHSSKKTASGDINGGGHRISLKTTNGNIKIKKLE
ncbi:MAG: DUF4097 family beta strand repeat protein [Deltaproteobacteria bacterium]|nr:DUF4097 family beta strand repeat protein [Deltaproteobacteria bacterium]